ncbi:hypothetical protein A1O3_08141 [Capronia epimyces CBS 606.96]|uniref:Uncharacterized protein n=1 Tax=Capronia epimyces CBS 606.96 TaxID=1182542 RepID=W9XSC5_9EURO|nr:uncharacterized protein A1O3_08141 [Capronia epimyces CBS 606.96]EXJ79856.1 hypothetical protein A1O3_08141 [Capronia epimyces CBS 606.96]
MSSRYPDDPDYRRGEPRHTSRREPRERDHRERLEPTRERRVPEGRMDRDTRMSDAMDTRMDTRLDTRIDPRLDSRMDARMAEQRPNTTSRIDPRPDRVDPEVILMRDANTGEIYREVRNAPARSPFAREERDYDAPSRSRATMEVPVSRDRDSIRPEYTEYFCPGEGIEREVIQHEICKYLGQDATCRPGRNNEVCCTGGCPWQWSTLFGRRLSDGSANENGGPGRAVRKVPMPTCKPDKKANEDILEKWNLTTRTMDAPFQGIVNLNPVRWPAVVLLFPLLLPTRQTLAILRSIPFLQAKQYILQASPIIMDLIGSLGLFPVETRHRHQSAEPRRWLEAMDSHPILPGQDHPSPHQYYLVPMTQGET